ncbi:MAG: TonB-dependent receptor [Burkholderiaceae bacterium]
MVKFRGAFAFAPVALACAVHAQAQGQPPRVLAPVTVTATRVEALPFDVPASVDVIGGDELRAGGRAQVNLAESLSLVPGLQARDRQNQAQDMQLSVRGFGARSTFGVRGVRIYVDGIPATLPDGQGQLSHIDIGSAGRLELLRGPFSVLYGNSSGGVLQVFTEEGEGEPAVTPSFALGSDGLRRSGIKLSGASGSVGYVFSAGRLGYDGWRDHAESSRRSFNTRLDWSLAEGRKLTLVANSLRLQAQDPLGLSRAQFENRPRGADAAAFTFDTRKDVQQDQLGLVYEHRVDASNRLRFMVYAGERSTGQYQAIPVATQAGATHPGGVIDLDRTYSGTDLRWTGQLSPSLEVVAGLAWDALDEDRRGFRNYTGAGATLATGVLGELRRDERNRVTSTDPYVQGTWKFGDRWTMNAGVRRSTVKFRSDDRYVTAANGDDSGEARYAQTLPALGVAFAGSPNLRLYAALGRGFETPTLNEIAYRPSGAPGPNFALRPSRSRNAEAGVKWRSPQEATWRTEAAAALFHTATSDEIVTQTNAGGRSTFQNAGATRRKGIEVSGAARKGPWNAQAALTLLDAKYRDGFLTCAATPCLAPALAVPAGNRIPGLARTVLSAELGWRPARGWNAGVDMRYLSKVFVNDANSDAAPSFAVAGANLGYVFDVRGWDLAAGLRVDNIAGRKYAGSVIVNDGNGRFFEPAAGRTWVASIHGTWRFR